MKAGMTLLHIFVLLSVGEMVQMVQLSNKMCQIFLGLDKTRQILSVSLIRIIFSSFCMSFQFQREAVRVISIHLHNLLTAGNGPGCRENAGMDEKMKSVQRLVRV